MSGYSFALCGVVLLIAGGCQAMVRNCAQIESCMEYFEGPCTNGQRLVCLRYRTDPTGTCAVAVFAATTGICVQNNFNPITPGPNVFVCDTNNLVTGGSLYTFGITSTFSTENTGSRPVTITNYRNGQATCSGYDSVCAASGNNDFRLTFQVTSCTSTATTTTLMPNCTCTAFQNFGSCSTTCGAGIQEQRRTCTNCPSFVTLRRFVMCTGNPTCTTTTTTPTTTTSRRVDGMWGPWGPFSACTATCGGGTQKRTRTCNNPPPSGGGQGCVEPMMETIICNVRSCPRPEPGHIGGCRRKAKRRQCAGLYGRRLRLCIRRVCKRKGSNHYV